MEGTCYSNSLLEQLSIPLVIKDRNKKKKLSIENMDFVEYSSSPIYQPGRNCKKQHLRNIIYKKFAYVLFKCSAASLWFILLRISTLMFTAASTPQLSIILLKVFIRSAFSRSPIEMGRHPSSTGTETTRTPQNPACSGFLRCGSGVKPAFLITGRRKRKLSV